MSKHERPLWLSVTDGVATRRRSCVRSLVPHVTQATPARGIETLLWPSRSKYSGGAERWTCSSWSLDCLLQCECHRLLERQGTALLPRIVEGNVIAQRCAGRGYAPLVVGPIIWRPRRPNLNP